MQKLDVEEAELRGLISDFSQEARNRLLVIHDIDDQLKEIFP